MILEPPVSYSRILDVRSMLNPISFVERSKYESQVIFLLDLILGMKRVKSDLNLIEIEYQHKLNILNLKKS